MQDSPTRPVVGLVVDWILVGAVMLGGAVGFFERSMLYHDEVINTYKAELGMVFDYALRPAFYAANVVAYTILGDSNLAIRAGAYAAFCATGIVLGLYVRRRIGGLAAFFAVGVFTAAPLIVHDGVRGMPHTHTALGILLSIVLALKAEEALASLRGSTLYCLSGVAGVYALSTHPTAAAFLVAYALVIGSLIVRAGVRNPRELWRSSRSWAVYGGLCSFVFLNLAYLLAHGDFYLTELLTSASRVDDSAQYHGSVWQYVKLAWRQVGVPLVASAMVFLAGTWFARRRHMPIPWVRLAALAVGCIVALAILSSITWKFDRVLVAYVAPFVLFSSFLFGVGVRGLDLSFGKTPALVVGSLLVLVVCAGQVSGASDLIRTQAARSPQDYHRYSAMQGALRLVEDEKILFVGGRKERTRAKRFSAITGHTLVPSLLRSGSAEFNGAALSCELSENATRIVYLGLIGTPPELIERARSAIGVLDAHLVYAWRGRAELWRVEPASQKQLPQLANIPSRTRVGVVGGEAIGTCTLQRVESRLESLGLRPYRLLGERTPERNLGYLKRNLVQHVIVPGNAVGFTALLEEHGAAKIDAWPTGNLDLWALPPGESNDH